MNRKISVLLTFTTIIIVCLGNLSFASGDDNTMSQKIVNVFNGVEGYSVVDSNDVDVTNDLLDKFGKKYDPNDVIDYFTKNDYCIKQDYIIIKKLDGTRGVIENRHYGSTYTKKVSKYHNGSLLERKFTFQIWGELDFDTTSGAITTIYYPTLYIVNIDEPTSITSAQVSSGTLSNNNRTVNHTVMINSKIMVQVYGDIYEWVDMPTIIQNYSYTPSTN